LGAAVEHQQAHHVVGGVLIQLHVLGRERIRQRITEVLRQGVDRGHPAAASFARLLHGRTSSMPDLVVISYSSIMCSATWNLSNLVMAQCSMGTGRLRCPPCAYRPVSCR